MHLATAPIVICVSSRASNECITGECAAFRTCAKGGRSRIDSRRSPCAPLAVRAAAIEALRIGAPCLASVRDYSASALMGRLINSRTASFAGSCSKRTRYTIAQSGISTCARAATVTMARAAA